MKTVSFLAALLLILALAVMPASAKKAGNGGKSKSKGKVNQSSGHSKGEVKSAKAKGGHYESGDNNGGRKDNVVRHENWGQIRSSEVHFRNSIQKLNRDWNRFHGDWTAWDRDWDQWDDSWDSSWHHTPNEESPDRDYILSNLRELVDRAYGDNLTPVARQVGHIGDIRVWQQQLPPGQYVLFLVGGSRIGDLAVRVLDTNDNLIAEDDQMTSRPSAWFDLDVNASINIVPKACSYNDGYTSDYAGMLLARR
jgi:hypothetical protein